MNKKSITSLTILLSIFVVGCVSSIGAVEAKDQKEIIPGELYFDIHTSYQGKYQVSFYDKDQKELKSLYEERHFSTDKTIDLDRKIKAGAAYMTIYAGAYWDGKKEKLIAEMKPTEVIDENDNKVINAGLIKYRGCLGTSANIQFEFTDGSYGRVEF